MKAVLLAAGRGVRLLPLTLDKPKVLIDVNGKPFLWYVLEHLRLAGFDDIGLVVGYKKEKVEAFVDGYVQKQGGMKITLIEQQKQLGTGNAVLCAQEFVGTDNFMVYYTDNLISMGDLRRLPVDDEFNYIMAMQVQYPERYGVLVHEGDMLLEIREKPQEYCGNWVNAGIYKFTPEVFALLDKVTLSPRGEVELTDAVTMLAKKRKVKVLKLKEYWLDLGVKDDIPKVGTFLKEEGR
ncbi:MAG: sugar phosphate nucleotidyltransferase [Nanoarchaeota archaeon]